MSGLCCFKFLSKCPGISKSVARDPPPRCPFCCRRCPCREVLRRHPASSFWGPKWLAARLARNALQSTRCCQTLKPPTKLPAWDGCSSMLGGTCRPGARVLSLVLRETPCGSGSKILPACCRSHPQLHSRLFPMLLAPQHSRRSCCQLLLPVSLASPGCRPFNGPYSCTPAGLACAHSCTAVPPRLAAAHAAAAPVARSGSPHMRCGTLLVRGAAQACTRGAAARTARSPAFVVGYY